jgi:hypothetical protein
MLDTTAVIEVFTAHPDARDLWRLSDEQLLDLLRKLETPGSLVTALQVDAAAQVEEFLCDYAARLTPQQLTQAGKHILAQFDPDGVHRCVQPSSRRGVRRIRARPSSGSLMGCVSWRGSRCPPRSCPPAVGFVRR